MELRAALEALLAEAETISERCEQVRCVPPARRSRRPPPAGMAPCDTPRARCSAVPTMPNARAAEISRYVVSPWQLPDAEQPGARGNGCGGLRRGARAIAAAPRSTVDLSTRRCGRAGGSHARPPHRGSTRGSGGSGCRGSTVALTARHSAMDGRGKVVRVMRPCVVRGHAIG